MMKPVIVVCEGGFAYFGYLGEDCVNRQVTIQRARMIVRYTSDVRGLGGLPAVGPSEHCRISHEIETVMLYQVIAILYCTEIAAQRFDASPWG